MDRSRLIPTAATCFSDSQQCMQFSRWKDCLHWLAGRYWALQQTGSGEDPRAAVLIRFLNPFHKLGVLNLQLMEVLNESDHSQVMLRKNTSSSAPGYVLQIIPSLRFGL